MAAGKQKTGQRDELHYIAQLGPTGQKYIGELYLLVDGKLAKFADRDNGKLKLYADLSQAMAEQQKRGAKFTLRLLGRAPTATEIKANKLS